VTSRKVIFHCLENNEIETTFSLDCASAAEGQEIAKALVGTNNGFGIVMSAEIWNITDNQIEGVIAV
jgi:hypothetical protein